MDKCGLKRKKNELVIGKAKELMMLHDGIGKRRRMRRRNLRRRIGITEKVKSSSVRSAHPPIPPRRSPSPLPFLTRTS